MLDLNKIVNDNENKGYRSRMCLWKDKNNCKHVWNEMQGHTTKIQEAITTEDKDNENNSKNVVQQFMDLKNIGNLKINESGNLKIIYKNQESNQESIPISITNNLIKNIQSLKEIKKDI